MVMSIFLTEPAGLRRALWFCCCELFTASELSQWQFGFGSIRCFVFFEQCVHQILRVWYHCYGLFEQRVNPVPRKSQYMSRRFFLDRTSRSTHVAVVAAGVPLSVGGGVLVWL
jgi:hypothetical protein